MKLFFAALVVFFAAGTSIAHAENFNGFYTGIEGSYERFHTPYDYSMTGYDPIQNANVDQSFSGSHNQYDIGGDVFGGYGYRFDNNIYLGGEIGVDLKHSETYSAGLRLGYVPEENTLLYIRGGYVRTRIHNDDVEFALNHDYLNGISGGAGIEIAFTDHITSRVEFLYTQYQRTTLTFDGASPGGDIASEQFKFHPDDAAAKIGLVYNF